MGLTGVALADRLGYPLRPPGPAARLVHAVTATRVASWALARLLRPADDLLQRTGRGRVSAPGLLAGLPVVVLTTTGARTALPRQAPLIPVVTPEVFAVLGTNFGTAPTPGWVHNLLAHPRAQLRFGDCRVPVRARLLTDGEREAVLAAAGSTYRGFRRYVERAPRQVHVFALEEVTP